MSIILNPKLISALETGKPAITAKLQAVAKSTSNGFFEIDTSQLPQLITDGWLPNQSPFAPPQTLTPEQLEALDGPGPGTELSKLIEKMIGATAFAGCGCTNHIAQMNAWGVDGCKANISMIVGWLKVEFSKMAPGLEFPVEEATALVEQAIENSEKSLGSEPDSNAP